MISNYRLTPSGWALILLSAVALALGGCGRKGPLDLPPTAAQSSTATPVAPDSDAARAAEPSVFNPTYGSDAGPEAPRGRKKSFVLDPLLGN